MSNYLAEMRTVSKIYTMGDSQVEVLKGLSFQILPGEAVSITGASGSGKSTFLHILGGLDEATSGGVFYLGQQWALLTEDQKAEIRNREIGFIFQLHHVLHEFSALENVMLPCRIAGYSKPESAELAEQALTRVGLQARLYHLPSQLSGGELQRVSIARAIVRKPKLLLADEPTGSLDSKTSLGIQELLFDLQSEYKMGLVVVTHDLTFASRFARCLRISDGQWI
jgi:lipoprotein-releasing system ATP-binding protein